MTARELLLLLHARGVEVAVVDGALRWRAPQGVMTPQAVAALRAAKPELVRLLMPPPPTPPPPALAAPALAPAPPVPPPPSAPARKRLGVSSDTRNETFLLQATQVIRIATGYFEQSRVVVRAVAPAGQFVLVSPDQTELLLATTAVPTGNLSIVPAGQAETFYLHEKQPLYARGSAANVTVSVITSEFTADRER